MIRRAKFTAPNLFQKENGKDENCVDAKSQEYLAEIRPRYDRWVASNDSLKGPTFNDSESDSSIVEKRLSLLIEYKDFIDNQKYAEAFDSRSNLHSSVLEEFVYYLFVDLVASFSGQPLIGKSHTFKDLFFLPASFSEMVERPYVRVEHKDHDFVIGARINGTLRCQGSTSGESFEFDVPAVAIECKTYLDKTMLEGSSTAAEQLKARNPNAIYIVVMEWLKLSNVNIRKYKVDQAFVLRKQRNTDREFRYSPKYVKNPMYQDVVWRLYTMVRAHLTAPWGGGIEDGMRRGWLL